MDRYKLEVLKLDSVISELHVYEETSSTNDRAKERARELLESAAAVCKAVGEEMKMDFISELFISEIQTAGRGRQGRAWESPPETGIWMSLLFNPSVAPEHISGITLLAAMSIAKSVRQIDPTLETYIKWPNDIVVNKKKICGILTEAIMDGASPDRNFLICGIGINVNTEGFPEDIRDKATSLRLESGFKWDREALANSVIRNLLEYTAKLEESQNLAFVKEEYDSMLISKDKEVILTGDNIQFPEGKYISRGIDETGALLVENSEGGIIAVSSGEVSVRGLYGYV